MKIIDTPIPDVKIIEPKVFGDERGFFMESFRDSWFREHVADVTFVQDNYSKSEAGILRGMHYQLKQTQGKLVGVTSGEVFDVAVDMRQSSSSFGQWFGTLLSAENKHQLESLLHKIHEKRELLQHQKKEINAMLRDLKNTEAICHDALSVSDRRKKAVRKHRTKQ